ncbi:SAV_2336 N-terminal domain-related protein, partial [Streptomyces nigra]|uniref:SAV_2336 N-terminal domain-related protein n=1 Tax=Streptomyces nigra TaxID=1827580 RepID=UPI0037F514B0
MIERLGPLLADLHPAEQPPTPREVAELIWLARHLPGGIGQGEGLLPLPPSRERPISSATADDAGPDSSRAGDGDRSGSDSTRLYLPGNGSPDEAVETEAVQAAPVRVGGPAALPRQRQLARALRPLKRRVPSTLSTVLDEEATAARIADHHHWIPVLTPAKDRWLDLVIVLDAYSESGIFWEPLARELRAVCQQLGAFRDVRLCHLLARSDGSPGLGTGSAAPPHLLRPTTSAVDPTGRTVILVLTDGVAPAWRSGTLREALRKWATGGPTAILQALPEHAWERTALAPEPGRFRTTEPGGANTTLSYVGYGLRPDGPKRGAIPVPVLGISPEWLAPWAHAIAQPAAFDAAAVLLPPIAELTQVGPVALDVHEALGRDVTFDDFRAQAQPEVFRLAAYLAAVPLNLAVMRAVQVAMLPNSPLADLAEIVYSGLLQRVHGGTRTDDVLSQAYEFVPGARERLLGTLRRDEADEVIAAVSAYMKRNAPAISARFTATVPELGGTLTLPAAARHWAEVHNLVRRRQGKSPDLVVPHEQAMPDVLTESAQRSTEFASRSAVPTARSTALVLTTLDFEYAAVRAHIEEPQRQEHPDGTWVEEGRLPNTRWQVAVAMLPTVRVGARLISWLRPEAVFVVGVAGSLKEDVEIGDVVVVTKVYETDGARATPDRILGLPASYALEQAARSAVRDMPDVRAHFLPIAATNRVPAGSDIVRRLREKYDAGAIELEGYGAIRAAYFNDHENTLVIRGISDHADAEKHMADTLGSQQHAAEQAAAVTMAVLRRHRPRHGSEDSDRLGHGRRDGQDRRALLTALAEGAGGDDGRLAVRELAQTVGLDADASVAEIAEAAGDPERREAVREWSDDVIELLAADPQGVAAVARAMDRTAPGSGTSWYGDHFDFRAGPFQPEVVSVRARQENTGAVPEVMAGLPSRLGRFTGRREEVAWLLEALDPDGGQSTRSAALPVTLVSGPGGIGKTALAVETAHLARERGWFPGGILSLDLHGYTPEPVTADHALQAMLHTLGVEPKHIPPRTNERAALYRSVLAELAREHGAMLILIDNASSHEQVWPLLPGDPQHHVLVTTRDRLPQMVGTRLRLVSLDRLSPQQAYELLDRALRIVDPNDSRVSDDPNTAERLADLCGHLPLALQIAAARLSANPGKPVTELVGELTESRDHLEHNDERELSLRAALELAYRQLPPGQARLLRLLALAPGPDVSDEVVAALVGAEEPPDRDLKALARAHLIEGSSERGQWRLHEVVRQFRADQAIGDAKLLEEGETAQERVLKFYCSRAQAANARLQGVPGRAEPEWFEDREQALAWLDDERAGLVAATGWGRKERLAGAVVRLAQSLTEYLLLRKHFNDLTTVAEAAREAARNVGDRRGEAMAWADLGAVHRTRHQVEEAIEAHVHARDLYASVGDRRGEAGVSVSLGEVLRLAGRVEEAIEAYRHAGDLYASVGDSRGEAGTWAGLGDAMREAGRVEEAIGRYRHALVQYGGAGNRRVSAGLSVRLGEVLREAGRVEEAIEAYTRARDLYGEAGDSRRTAWVSVRLGEVLRKAGRVEEAIEAHARARDLYGEVGDHPGEAKAWVGLGEVLREAGRVEEAIEAYARARDLYGEAGDRGGEAGAWVGLGAALPRAGRVEEAIEAHARARDLYGEVGDHRGEAKAWVGLGEVLREAGRVEEAIEAYARARD